MTDDIFISEYQRNYKKLFLVALSILKETQAAEDAVQNAALKTYKNIHDLNNTTLFSTWITRILINECKMIIRSRKRNNINIPIDQLSEEEYISFDNTQLNFFNMISNLKEADKQILSLRYFNQMTLEDISSVLEIPLSTVKSRLYRSLKKLKKEWGE